MFLEAGAVNAGKLDTRWQSADTLGTIELALNEKETFNKVTIFEYQDAKDLPDSFSQMEFPLY